MATFIISETCDNIRTVIKYWSHTSLEPRIDCVLTCSVEIIRVSFNEA